MNDNSYKIIEVDLNEILPNRFQPRIQFNEEEILELSDSIKEHGVIQPLVVRTIGDKYEIIAGERRYKASVLAGKETVPVIIKNLNDKDSAEIALIENIQRKNLTPIEEALSYKKILDMGYLTQESLATKIGKSQSSVANKIRLLNLSDEVQEALLENKISERHARSLLKLKSITKQKELLNRIIQERLTVRKTDEEIEKILSNKEEKGEKNMNNNNNNNNNNQVPKFEVPTSTTFDIFGNEQSQTLESMPSMVAPNPVNEFMPIQPEMPKMESAPSMVAPNPVSEFMPIQPEMPKMESAPSMVAPNPVNEFMPIQPEMPKMESAPSMVAPNPVSEFKPIQPEMPKMESAPSMVAPNPVNEFMPIQPEMPKMESTPSMVAPNPVSEFKPIQPEMPKLESAPSMVAPNPVSEFMPIQPEMPKMESAPSMVAPNPVSEFKPIQPEMPKMESTPSMVAPNPVSEVVPAQTDIIKEDILPPAANYESSGIPNMAPIIDSTALNNSQLELKHETNNIQGPATINEISKPEPIIITDYTKQYDPVMPTNSVVAPAKSDFKEIINAIRECSSKIEKFGYKIDVEEYDLTQLYQVVFKIEK